MDREQHTEIGGLRGLKCVIMWVILLCIRFVQVLWASGVFWEQDWCGGVWGFSDSTDESILNSLEAVYLSNLIYRGLLM